MGADILGISPVTSPLLPVAQMVKTNSTHWSVKLEGNFLLSDQINYQQNDHLAGHFVGHCQNVKFGVHFVLVCISHFSRWSLFWLPEILVVVDKWCHITTGEMPKMSASLNFKVIILEHLNDLRIKYKLWHLIK